MTMRQAASIGVQTQGIANDWLSADGAHDIKSRGLLSDDQLLSAMLHLARLDTPDIDDACPPHVLVEGTNGQLSFVGQGGSIFCVEVGREMNADEATGLVLGKSGFAPPPPPLPGAETKDNRTARRKTKAHAATTATPTTHANPAAMRRKLGWRGVLLLLMGFGFLIAAAFPVAGAISMSNRGVNTDDIWAALIIAALLAIIGITIIYLAFKRRAYVDEVGNVLPYVVMAQLVGGDSFDDIGDDFD